MSLLTWPAPHPPPPVSVWVPIPPSDSGWPWGREQHTAPAYRPGLGGRGRVSWKEQGRAGTTLPGREVPAHELARAVAQQGVGGDDRGPPQPKGAAEQGQALDGVCCARAHRRGQSWLHAGHTKEQKGSRVSPGGLTCWAGQLDLTFQLQRILRSLSVPGTQPRGAASGAGLPGAATLSLASASSSAGWADRAGEPGAHGASAVQRHWGQGHGCGAPRREDTPSLSSPGSPAGPALPCLSLLHRGPPHGVA